MEQRDTTARRGAVSRGVLKRLVGYPALIGGALLALWLVSIRMPGRSFAGAPPALSADEAATVPRLAHDVSVLADSIGYREAVSAHDGLERAAEWLSTRLSTMGLPLTVQEYRVRGDRAVRNLSAHIAGTDTTSFVLVGAHYDAVAVTPGADDNASGVAATLELTRRFAERPASCAVRIVLFTNEEPPFFWSDSMGSLVYARAMAARGERPAAMLSLESLGYYSDREGSQSYPPVLGWFYPSRGDFVAFVGDVGSRGLVHRAIEAFREVATIPSAGSAAPHQFPGIGWSDHWAFWQVGLPAVMVTGTAPYRNRHYHEETDVPAHLDFARLARVVTGLEHVVRRLCVPR
jgi:hypothetical protein